MKAKKSEESLKSDQTYMRYERKFFIENLSRQAVESIIYQHPAAFRELYQPRQVSSLYFDTYDFVDLVDKVDGNALRQKYRIRWYEEQAGKLRKPFFEIKRKVGLLGEKERFGLKDFSWEELKAGTAFTEGIAAQLPPTHAFALRARQPSLYVAYQRRYWLSRDGKYRLTLDWDMCYAQPRVPLAFLSKDRESLILELKYDQEDDRRAEQISSWFPFRVTRSSKYGMGMSRS